MNAQGDVMIENRRKSNLKVVALTAMLAGVAGYAYAADMPLKAPPPPKPVPFFFVNDTSVSATWYFNSTDPGVSGGSDVVPGGIFGAKNSFYRASGSVDHFDIWEYGTNLIHLELDQYSKKDPILGEPGAVGSRELFSFTRSTIGFNEITHSKAFNTFFTNDIGFEGGFNAGVQNNYLAEQTTKFLVGTNIDVKIPKPLGTLLVGVLAVKEFTHNQFNACGPAGFGDAQSPAAGLGGGTCIGGGSFSGDRDFKWTWGVESFYSVPLAPLGPWADPLHVVSILNVYGPKGTGISTANCLAVGCFGPAGAFNNSETKTEVFEDVRLILDASKVFWAKPGIWDAYVGYRYWANKFGTNHNAFLFANIAPETSVESTAYVGTTYHFK
jgi:hypothetical protein